MPSIWNDGNYYGHHGFRRTFAMGMPQPAPLTLIFSLWVDSTPNPYHTIFFVANTGYGTGDYYGAAIGPWGGGGSQAFAVSDGTDTASINPTTGRWYRQCFRCRQVSTNFEKDYFVDLPRTTGSSHTYPAWALTSTHNLRFGNAEWGDGETFCGAIGNIKIFQAWLTDLEMQIEAQHALPVLPHLFQRVWAVIPGIGNSTRIQDIWRYKRHFIQTGDGFPGADALSQFRDPPEPSYVRRPSGIYVPRGYGINQLALAQPSSTVTGTFASTLGAVQAAFAGAVTNRGTFASTLNPVTAAFLGQVGNAATGTFASTLGAVQAAFQGTVTDRGQFASTLGSVIANFQGMVTNPGVFNSTLGAVQAAFSGAVGNAVVGSFASTLNPVQAAFAGTVTAPPVTGTFASTLGRVQAQFYGNVATPGGVSSWRMLTGHGQ